MNKNACVSYSLGKDSTLALYRAIKQGYNVKVLIVTININNNRSWFHGVDIKTIKAVAQSLNIKVIFAKSKGEDYKKAFISALNKAKKLGVSNCIFGDIDLIEHYNWCSKVCKQVNLTAVFPLWQENRKALVKEFIDLGFKAVIKVISKKHELPKSFLGKPLTKEVLKELEKYNIDVCGENGEFHTFVYGGLLFSKEIKIKPSAIYESNNAFSLILELA